MPSSVYIASILLVLVIGLKISASPLDGTRKIFHLLKAGITNPVHVFAAGCVSGLIAVPILKHALRRAYRYFIRRSGADGDSVYGLGHGILNVEILPRGMWMNMGFWKVKSELRICIMIN